MGFYMMEIPREEIEAGNGCQPGITTQGGEQETGTCRLGPGTEQVKSPMEDGTHLGHHEHHARIIQSHIPPLLRVMS